MSYIENKFYKNRGVKSMDMFKVKSLNDTR